MPIVQVRITNSDHLMSHTVVYVKQNTQAKFLLNCSSFNPSETGFIQIQPIINLGWWVYKFYNKITCSAYDFLDFVVWHTLIQ